MAGMLCPRAPAAVRGGENGGPGSDVCPFLSLSANGIGPRGGVRLAKSLAPCKHLEELM